MHLQGSFGSEQQAALVRHEAFNGGPRNSLLNALGDRSHNHGHVQVSPTSIFWHGVLVHPHTRSCYEWTGRFSFAKSAPPR